MNKYLALTALGLIMLAMAFLVSYQVGILGDFQREPQPEQQLAASKDQVIPSVVQQVPAPDSEEARKLTLGEPSPPPRPNPKPVSEETAVAKDSESLQPAAPEAQQPKVVEADLSEPSTQAAHSGEKPEIRESAENASAEQKLSETQADLLELAEKAQSESQLAKPAKPVAKPSPQVKETDQDLKASPAAPQAVAEPPAKAAEPASESKVNKIESVVVASKDGSVVMTIKTRSAISAHKYFTLKVPVRFVVDLYGKWEKEARIETQENSAVKAVRLGLHPDKYRVVADLTSASVTGTINQIDPQTLEIHFK